MPNAIGREFMERTRHHNMAVSDQSRGAPLPPLTESYDDSSVTVELTAPQAIQVPEVSLRQVIEQRRSVRRYTRDPLTLPELSFLLWCTQGVRETVQGHATFRNVPSAGARHALETYLLVNRVSGVDAGIYRYLPIEHRLLALSRRAGIANRITRACFDQSFVESSAVTFIWAAVPYRMSWRYGERGYRYLHLDAGHVCQNLYLAGESIGCGVCAIAAFSDDDINTLLDLDGEQRFVIYLAALGKKPA